MKHCRDCRTEFEGAWLCPACGWVPPTENGRPLFAPSLAQGGGEDGDYLFDELQAAEPRHFWFRSRLRLLLWALRHFFPDARRVLDLGCGTGFFLEGVRGLGSEIELSGGDLRSEGLAGAAQRTPDASLFQVDAGDLPFRREFDVIGTFDVIEHISDDLRVLREMHCALRPGGGLLLTVPQHPFIWSDADELSHHQRRYTRRELASRLEAAGFRTLRMTSFCAVLMPLLVARRLTQRFVRAPFDPHAELRIPPANALLERIMGWEQRLIRRGWFLPMGTSLLAVASAEPSATA